ncbi:MAG: hypothetical protein C4518_01415 [Desulfobacteraceae bacterium]|nr:MAG: hypothetical protein C4518_01415 [Desulfobacteraceae bacterium]
MGNKKVSQDKLIEYCNYTDSIKQELATQTDRGLAVLSITFLDVLLENILDSFFISDLNFQKTLFGPDKPLGSFNSKLLLSHALGLISDCEKHELNNLRKIRNIFSHDFSIDSFEKDSIKDRCMDLKIPEILYSPSFANILESQGILVNKVDGDYKSPSDLGARERFVESVNNMAVILMLRFGQSCKNQCVKSDEFKSLEDLYANLLKHSEWQQKKHQILVDKTKQQKLKLENYRKEYEEKTGKKCKDLEKIFQNENDTVFIKKPSIGHDELIERLKKVFQILSSKAK